MARYWIGPWVWQSVDRPAWVPPVGSVASIDLRSPGQCAIASTVDGWGLFATPNATNLGSDYTNLGTDPDTVWSGAAKAAWRSRLSMPSAIQAQTLRELLVETLLVQADPTGDRVQPIVPTSSIDLEIWLGGRAWSRKFDVSETAYSRPVLDILKREYRAVRAACIAGDLPPRLYRKVLGYWARKYGLPYQLFQPNDVPDEEPDQPETTITDNFNRSNSSGSLGTSSEGWSWANVTFSWDIASNQASTTLSGARCRANSDLSSADHYSQAAFTSGSDDRVGPAVRMAAAADTCYYGMGRNNASVTFRTTKRVTGTNTNLASTNTTAFTSGTLKLEANGSSITLYRNGVAVVGPTTDTAITGNVRTGISCETYTSNSKADDFEAADLGGAAVALAGTIAAAATVTGEISLALPLAGSVAAVSTVTGSAVVAYALAGSSAGQSTVAGDVSIAIALAGEVAGQSSVSGALAVSFALAGQVDGESSVTGDASITRGLAGVVTWQSAVTGEVSLAIGLAGTVAGVSSVAGAIVVDYSLAGVSAGVSAATGTLTVVNARIFGGTVLYFAEKRSRFLAPQRAKVNRFHAEKRSRFRAPAG